MTCFASSTAIRRLAIVGLCFLLGCKERTGIEVDSTQSVGTSRAVMQADEDGSGAAGQASMEDADAPPPEEPRIAPGTPLAKSAFQQTLAETGAKWIVVQVYMEACGPCITEAIHMTEKLSEWQRKGIAVIGLGMDETATGPKTFFRQTGQRVTYPLYLAPWFAEEQEVYSAPTIFVYDSAGNQLLRADPETAENGIMATVEAKLADLTDNR